MAHAQEPDFVFRRNGRVNLNRWGRQFSRLLAVELCASAVVILDTPCSEIVWRVLSTHSIRQFPLHFSSRASPCAITFQLESTLISHSGRSLIALPNGQCRKPVPFVVSTSATKCVQFWYLWRGFWIENDIAAFQILTAVLGVQVLCCVTPCILV
jgi:hypothetical protein